MYSCIEIWNDVKFWINLKKKSNLRLVFDIQIDQSFLQSRLLLFCEGAWKCLFFVSKVCWSVCMCVCVCVCQNCTQNVCMRVFCVLESNYKIEFFDQFSWWRDFRLEINVFKKWIQQTKINSTKNVLIQWNFNFNNCINQIHKIQKLN